MNLVRTILAVMLLTGLSFAQHTGGGASGGGTGSGTVGNCAGAGIASYAGAGTTVGCDQNILDSAGGLTLNAGVTHLTSTQGSLSGGSLPFLTHTVTWNNGSTVFVDRFTNITCTAAATGAAIFDYQLAAASVMSLKFASATCTTPFLTIPAGSALQAGLVFVGDTSSGLARIGANAYCFTTGAVCQFYFNAGNFFQLTNAHAIAWTSTTDANGTKDTCIDRPKPKVIRLDGNSSCSDGLGYRVDGNKTFVTSDFTTAANTSFQAITGLLWTFPTSLAVNYSFHCAFQYSQATANAAVAFGVQTGATQATNVMATGVIATSTTAQTYGNFTSTTPGTSANSVVSATPSAITTIWNAYLDGTIEAPSNATPTVFSIQVSTATSGDAVTVKRGSYCALY